MDKSGEEFLESKGLEDLVVALDDEGEFIFISELLEEYHKKQLSLNNVMGSSLSSEEKRLLIYLLASERCNDENNSLKEITGIKDKEPIIVKLIERIQKT